MMSAPRMMPPAIATSVPMPETRPERTPVAIDRDRVVDCFPGRVQFALVDAECVGLTRRLVECLVDGGADVIGLVGHAADGSDQHTGHQDQEAEDDQAGSEAKA